MNTGMAQGSYASNSTVRTEPPSSSNIGAAANELERISQRLRDEIQRAKNIADDYFGSNPEPVPGAIAGLNKSMQPKSVQLSDAVNDMANLVSQMSAQIDRLTCV